MILRPLTGCECEGPQADACSLEACTRTGSCKTGWRGFLRQWRGLDSANLKLQNLKASHSLAQAPVDDGSVPIRPPRRLPGRSVHGEDRECSPNSACRGHNSFTTTKFAKCCLLPQAGVVERPIPGVTLQLRHEALHVARLAQGVALHAAAFQQLLAAAVLDCDGGDASLTGLLCPGEEAVMDGAVTRALEEARVGEGSEWTARALAATGAALRAEVLAGLSEAVQASEGSAAWETGAEAMAVVVVGPEGTSRPCSCPCRVREGAVVCALVCPLPAPSAGLGQPPWAAVREGRRRDGPPLSKVGCDARLAPGCSLPRSWLGGLPPRPPTQLLALLPPRSTAHG